MENEATVRQLTQKEIDELNERFPDNPYPLPCLLKATVEKNKREEGRRKAAEPLRENVLKEITKIFEAKSRNPPLKSGNREGDVC